MSIAQGSRQICAECQSASSNGEISAGARLYSTLLKPCAGRISGKTSGNRGPVAQVPSARAVSIGVTLATVRATERLTLGAMTHRVM
jgi:hypothetical protein